MQIWKRVLALIIALAILCVGCSMQEPGTVLIDDRDKEGSWHFGFGRAQILPNEESDQPLYIAGYNNGWEVTEVLDYCEARAVWMDAGAQGILLISIDCVALDSHTVAEIREALKDIPNCASINVCATHTHAGADTLGLWGPIGVNGKNYDYMKALIEAAVSAGKEAAAAPKAGKLYYGYAETQDMYRDSRDPQVYDPNLYQLRFEPETGNGLRLFFYGAHAESLRGDNTRLSRDFAGGLCDGVTEAVGDDTMFCAGAIGGLIMTKEFVYSAKHEAVQNLQITSEKLVDYALSITAADERELAPKIALSRTVFSVPLDNTAFLLYKMLGILGTKAVKADSATGYGVETELSVLLLDDLALTMIPGEIFPELVLGTEYGDANQEGVNPVPLLTIAQENGIREMIVIGLCNDEIGYIVPPSDFLLNEKMPYLEKIMDYKGENHYEETNSVGPMCAEKIAEAFEETVEKLF